MRGEEPRRSSQTRLTPGEKRSRKRMAQVATVYSIAPFVRSAADLVHPLRDRTLVEARRPRPTDKRVWASVEKSCAHRHPRGLRRGAAARPDTSAAVGRSGRRPADATASGQSEARRAGVKVTILVDLVHVLEYVWDAARGALRREQPEGRELGGRSTSGAADRTQRRGGGADDPLVGSSPKGTYPASPSLSTCLRLSRRPHTNTPDALPRGAARWSSHRHRGDRRAHAATS